MLGARTKHASLRCVRFPSFPLLLSFVPHMLSDLAFLLSIFLSFFIFVLFFLCYLFILCTHSQPEKGHYIRDIQLGAYVRFSFHIGMKKIVFLCLLFFYWFNTKDHSSNSTAISGFSVNFLFHITRKHGEWRFLYFCSLFL